MSVFLIILLAGVLSVNSCPSQCQCDRTAVDCSHADLDSVDFKLPHGTTELYLQGNRLHEVPLHAVSDLKHLRVINLGDNRILKIEREELELLDLVDKVILQGNPIHCSCAIISFTQQSLIFSTSDNKESTFNDVICHTPDSLAGKPLKELKFLSTECGHERSIRNADQNTTGSLVNATDLPTNATVSSSMANDSNTTTATTASAPISTNVSGMTAGPTALNATTASPTFINTTTSNGTASTTTTSGDTTTATSSPTTLRSTTVAITGLATSVAASGSTTSIATTSPAALNATTGSAASTATTSPAAFTATTGSAASNATTSPTASTATTGSAASNATTSPAASTATTGSAAFNATTSPAASTATTGSAASNATTSPVASTATTDPVTSNATTTLATSNATIKPTTFNATSGSATSNATIGTTLFNGTTIQLTSSSFSEVLTTAARASTTRTVTSGPDDPEEEVDFPRETIAIIVICAVALLVLWTVMIIWLVVAVVRKRENKDTKKAKSNWESVSSLERKAGQQHKKPSRAAVSGEELTDAQDWGWPSSV